MDWDEEAAQRGDLSAQLEPPTWASRLLRSRMTPSDVAAEGHARHFHTHARNLMLLAQVGRVDQDARVAAGGTALPRRRRWWLALAQARRGFRRWPPRANTS